MDKLDIDVLCSMYSFFTESSSHYGTMQHCNDVFFIMDHESPAPLGEGVYFQHTFDHSLLMDLALLTKTYFLHGSISVVLLT